jgi:hypothetical protein
MVFEVSIFLRCGTISMGKILVIFTPEDEFIRLSQNIRHQLSQKNRDLNYNGAEV